MFKKIVSGGQTGADRAALDFAIKNNIPHGGWVPKGRIAEDGPIAGEYNLKVMPTDSYHARTEHNVIDSDGTLIISHGPLTGGSRYTYEMAKQHRKPCLVIDLARTKVYEAGATIMIWVTGNEISTLKVEAHHAATAEDVIEACGIARQAIENALSGAPDMAADPAVQAQVDHLTTEAGFTLQFIQKLPGNRNIDAWTDPESLAKSVRLGVLDAPQLQNNPISLGRIKTRILNGSCTATNSAGIPLREAERLKNLLK